MTSGELLPGVMAVFCFSRSPFATSRGPRLIVWPAQCNPRRCPISTTREAEGTDHGAMRNLR